MDDEEKLEYPAWFQEVALDFPDLVTQLYDSINRTYGTSFSPPF